MADFYTVLELPRTASDDEIKSAYRKLAIAPVVIAKTSRPVTVDVPVIEACRLQSDKGIAIVLLNWLAQDQKQITVKVPNAGKFRKVTSIEGAAVTTTATGNDLTFTLPLKACDVLMIE